MVDRTRNPDVLVISEMRTPEVMRLTLDAAETGHLVLATMHSATCGEALNRLCMSFPSDIQSSIRATGGRLPGGSHVANGCVPGAVDKLRVPTQRY